MKDPVAMEKRSSSSPFHRFSEFSCTFQDIGAEIRSGKVWNLPNLIMVTRLILGIRAINFLKTCTLADRWIALPLVMVAIALDMLDGYIARKFNQQTLFGKTFDPLVDKCLLIYGMISIFIMLDIPLSLSLGFMSTHFFMVTGSVFLMLTDRVLPAVRSYGAVSNVLAVISAIFYWLGSARWGRRILIMAITSGYALLLDYAHRIDWRKKSARSTSPDKNP